MSKFKVGDIITSMKDQCTDISIGNKYVVIKCEFNRVYFKDDDGCSRSRTASDYELSSSVKDKVALGVSPSFLQLTKLKKKAVKMPKIKIVQPRSFTVECGSEKLEVEYCDTFNVSTMTNNGESNKYDSLEEFALYIKMMKKIHKHLKEIINN